jgi:hypothetical protein
MSVLGKRKAMKCEGQVAEQPPSVLQLIELLAHSKSPLYGYLRVSDLFMVRRTCKAAWRAVHHRTLTKANAVAAASGQGGSDAHIPMLRWCLHNGATFNDMGWTAVGKTGNASLLEESLECGKGVEIEDLLVGAARGGHADSVDWLAQRVAPHERDEVMDEELWEALAEGGLLDCAKKYYGDPSDWRRELVRPALRRGHLPFVQWVASGASPSTHAKYSVYAAQSGSVELMRWLVDQGWSVDGDTVIAAAQAGNVDLLKYLAEHGGAVSNECVVKSAGQGHMDVVDWLIRRGCELTPDVLYTAARRQKRAVVAALLDLQCPHDERELALAACENVFGTELFEWLVERGVECDATACIEETESATWFDSAILCRRFDLPLPEHYMLAAAEESDIDRLRHGLAKGLSVDREALQILVRNTECAMIAEALALDDTPGATMSDTAREVLDSAIEGEGGAGPELTEFLGKYAYDVKEYSEESDDFDFGDDSESS